MLLVLGLALHIAADFAWLAQFAQSPARAVASAPARSCPDPHGDGALPVRTAPVLPDARVFVEPALCPLATPASPPPLIQPPPAIHTA